MIEIKVSDNEAEGHIQIEGKIVDAITQFKAVFDVLYKADSKVFTRALAASEFAKSELFK